MDILLKVVYKKLATIDSVIIRCNDYNSICFYDKYKSNLKIKIEPTSWDKMIIKYALYKNVRSSKIYLNHYEIIDYITELEHI